LQLKVKIRKEIVDMKSRLIFVGGFLGSGKTTLLWACARRLTGTGQTVQLITNDQASALVDTAFLERVNEVVTEVSGSCFCCNFNGLVNAILTPVPDGLADIIIAEPVGSCTDLSATLIQPLKEKFGSDLHIAPLSVLADPERLVKILDGGTSGLHESAAYIFRKQLEEADFIVISKSDLLDKAQLENLVSRTAQKWPLAKVLSMSSITGDGLDHWLTEVMGSDKSGTHLADVDYDIYAEGEAVLGWLNVSYSLSSQQDEDWDNLLQSLMNNVEKRLDRIKAPIGHIKVFLESGSQFATGNLTGGAESLCLRGKAGIGKAAKLTLNARVEMNPSELENIVDEVLKECVGDSVILNTMQLNSLSPGRPNPTYRFDHLFK
jgi:G3E family GTPase